MKRYAVVFEKAPNNWAAYVPDLPGCVTTGRTIEETRRLIAEAVEFHIEGMRLRGEAVPEPTAVRSSRGPGGVGQTGAPAGTGTQFRLFLLPRRRSR